MTPRAGSAYISRNLRKVFFSLWLFILFHRIFESIADTFKSPRTQTKHPLEGLSYSESGTYTPCFTPTATALFSIKHIALTTYMIDENRVSVASFPHEILSYIFILHLYLHLDSHCTGRTDLTLLSIPISHVSRTWRETGLSTPWLWTTLTQIPPEISQAQSRFTMQF